MINCDEMLLGLMADKNKLDSFFAMAEKGEPDAIFSLEKFKSFQPYIVSENVFIQLLDMAKTNKKYEDLLKEIKGFIIISENVTDKVFDRLLNMAKSGMDWLFLDLCHANLPKDKQKILRALNLPDSLWY